MRFILIIILGIIIWGYWVINSHPQNAIVSWDEGFHGGTALFISEGLRNNLDFKSYTYILNDFKNGIIWYLPLWWGIAGLMGAIFNPSVEIYRLTTLIFSSLSIILIAFFVKNIAGKKAGLIAAISLAFVPIFIIYSHLMMIEIPLLFSTSLAILSFYRYLTKQILTRVDLIFILFAATIGVSTKITAVALIFGVLLTFGVFLKLFLKDSKVTRRFYSKWTIYFFTAVLVTFTVFRYSTRTFLNADLLSFYLGQTKQLTGQQGNILLIIAKTLFDNSLFYLRDLSHMLPLAFFWIASFIAYLLLKRSLLASFLLIWVIITYLIFSAVKPQAVQYILPIFAPLCISVGLFWGEFLKHRRKVSNLLFIPLVALIAALGLFYLDKSETIGWKNTITNQQNAAVFVAKNAKIGDRVITTGDGTRFLIRLAGFDKKLQTINGAAPFCTQFIQDSVEWMVLDNGPQSPIKLNSLKNSNWIMMAKFPTSLEETVVLKNTNQTEEIVLENEDFIHKSCVRLLSLGKNEISFYMTAYISQYIPGENLQISLKVNPLKSLKDFIISQEELNRYDGQEHKYTLIFEQAQPNKPIYMIFEIPKNLQLIISKIEIKKINE